MDIGKNPEYRKTMKQLSSKRIIVGDGVACYSASAVGGFREKDAGSLAGSMLSNGEKIAMGFFTPGKKAEWLLGRLAAKSAVKDLLKNDNIGMKDISIKSTRKTPPRCRIRSGKGKIFLSISHSGNAAVAAASKFPIGIDMEFARHFSKNLRALVFNKSDSLNAKKDAEAYYTSMWCAKEAAAKALGLGTGIDFRRIKLKNGKKNSAIASWDSRLHEFEIILKKADNAIIAIAIPNER